MALLNAANYNSANVRTPQMWSNYSATEEGFSLIEWIDTVNGIAATGTSAEVFVDENDKFWLSGIIDTGHEFGPFIGTVDKEIGAFLAIDIDLILSTGTYKIKGIAEGGGASITAASLTMTAT